MMASPADQDHPEGSEPGGVPEFPAAYPTVEVRWFRTGPIPTSMEAWMRETWEEPEEEPIRLDYYLQPVEPSETLGIKVREGRIEIKMRSTQMGVIQFGRRARGYLESWRKWGLDLDDGRALDRMVGSDRHWLAVEKWRRLARYPHPDNPSKSSGDSRPPGGCEVELSTIIAGGRLWWSLALEAQGEPALGRQSLEDVAEKLWDSPGAPTPGLDDSYAYPRWLWSRVALVG